MEVNCEDLKSLVKVYPNPVNAAAEWIEIFKKHGIQVIVVPPKAIKIYRLDK